MAKNKVKFGKVDLKKEDLSEADALIRISMMLPLSLYKQLKTLSLDEKYQGKYQVLIKDILRTYAEDSSPKTKGKKAS